MLGERRKESLTAVNATPVIKTLNRFGLEEALQTKPKHINNIAQILQLQPLMISKFSSSQRYSRIQHHYEFRSIMKVCKENCMSLPRILLC